MVWFLSGAIFGAIVYHFVNKRNEPNYHSLAYAKSQIAEHEILASYYKKILENQKQ